MVSAVCAFVTLRSSLRDVYKRQEYIYPNVGNRMSPKEWNEAGKPLLLDTAIARKNEILAKAGSVIDPQIDQAIRATYNIYFK